MKEIVDDVERWRQRGEQIAIATVVATRKLRPAPGRREVRGLGAAARCAARSRAAASRATSSSTHGEVLETGHAAAAHLRHLRRRGARRRPALRRRDRRVRRAPRLTSAHRLLELAHGDERAVVFTMIDGPDRAKLVVLLDRDETHGRGRRGLAALAPEIRRSGLIEHEGRRSSPRCSVRPRASSSSARSTPPRRSAPRPRRSGGARSASTHAPASRRRSACRAPTRSSSSGPRRRSRSVRPTATPPSSS